MHPLTVIRDSLRFFNNNLPAIARACLPLIVLHAICAQLLEQVDDDGELLIFGSVLNLMFTPLYTAALFLFLDAHRQGQQPSFKALASASLSMWPVYVGLMVVLALIFMAGTLLLVIPGIWIAIRLVVAQPLLVVKGLGLVEAISESFRLTRGHFWPIFGSVLGAALPIMVLMMIVYLVYPGPRQLIPAVVIDSLCLFMGLFISTVTYRLWTELSDEQPDVPADGPKAIADDQPVA
ncbi:glycerophosphoryl diester phosphodiesterase membrane domain-containing protein [Pseudomonas sp. HR96]|uniref:glycerophosphoryl diester phosphodiesterase membrane domain-containing protein n=1 Tax=Pseudomonas sp. HR96 TaxID=1027966 RepID=UPI002A74F78F|nr:glycerophosphoryl diester phosphodiesterase membrane domain-containing protein [Pseudomonas sp. HR96]WPO99406.1 glycerophosphoryl diester phosphodiesterase membrane domain-containing protein [Pseudomonas sp. HR96]